MRLLFVNIPFLEYRHGVLHTGPCAGSCWSHTAPGLYSYVPRPFFLANATTYARLHGIDADFYDGWAYRRTNYEEVKQDIRNRKPEIIVIEMQTPVASQVQAMAQWAKEALGCRVVIVGQHMAAYAQQTLELPFVDHVVRGEFDEPCRRIASGDTTRYFEGVTVDNTSYVNGQNWTPHIDPVVLPHYLDPSMVHTPMQLQVNTSRSCPWRCSYCAWPQTSYNKFRLREAAAVIGEIAEVQRRFPLGSIFFDDETFGLGPKDRLRELCTGLKQIGVPWSIMTRSDVWSCEEMEMYVEHGCVGARIGVESFHQHLLDRVDKKLDAKVSWENMHWLVGRFSGFQIRLLTMKNLPGETEMEEHDDYGKFLTLQDRATQHGNICDIQRADCTPLPGTKLWHQLNAAGKSGEMQNFDEFQPIPTMDAPLAKRLNVYSDAVKLTVKET